MVQIGPIKYNKDEEAVLTRSILLSTFLGFPSGLLLNYWFGFLVNPGLAANDSLGWTIFYFKVGSVIISVCWLITAVSSLLLYKRKRKTRSKRDIGRILFASLFVPIALIYTFLVAGFIGISVNAFLVPHLGPITTWGIGALVFFPFMILFIAIVGPDSKPGRALRRFIRRARDLL